MATDFQTVDLRADVIRVMDRPDRQPQNLLLERTQHVELRRTSRAFIDSRADPGVVPHACHPARSFLRPEAMLADRFQRAIAIRSRSRQQDATTLLERCASRKSV